jgi:hypothetical protein
MGDQPKQHPSARRRDTDRSQDETIRLPTMGGDLSQAETMRLMAPDVDTSQYDTVLLAALRPHRKGASSGTGRARRSPGLRLAQALFVMILFINVVGIGGVWGVQALSVTRAATTSLQRHMARIQALAPEVGALQPDVLRQMQIELSGADSDVRSLNELIPFNGALEVGGQGSAHRVLTLGQHALDAAQEGTAAAIILQPALQGLVYSATHSQANPVASGQHLLTPNDVLVAQSHLDQAKVFWAAVVEDRKSISDADLESMHNPQMTALVRKLDALLPVATSGFELASALLDWAPHIMGLFGPAHILLFDMDTDELRATGGFLGNYADLVMNGGALTSGIHLHDIYTLDCPNQVCPLRPVPDAYSWFKIAGATFGVRDSNLNPDFPTAAGLAEHLYEMEGGPPSDIVVAITPDVVEGVLRALGPTNEPHFGVTVTAETLRSQIHFYHQNPQIATRLGISASALGTSIAKVFDVLVSQAIFAKLGTLTPQQQSAIVKSLHDFLTTKDIQLFATNTRVEEVFKAIGVAGQVIQSTGDGIYFVDTNDGASYANADIRESMTDQVTLDAKGGATHALSVTYTYAQVAHTYVQNSEYRNLARVIVPSTATHLATSGPCTPVDTIQSFQAVIACQFSLARGAEKTISFSWYVPSIVTAGQTPTYSLLVQRQAGTTHAVHITVAPAPGTTLSKQGSSGAIAGGNLDWTQNPQTGNTTLVVGVRS